MYLNLGLKISDCRLGSRFKLIKYVLSTHKFIYFYKHFFKIIFENYEKGVRKWIEGKSKPLRAYFLNSLASLNRKP